METQRRFKEELKLPFTLLSDEGGKVSKLYGGVVPLVGLPKRATYVLAEDGRVTAMETGDAAVDPTSAIASCPVGRASGRE